MKFYLLTILGAMSAACARPRPPSPQAWTARGDALLESNPGRALANYDRAGTAASDDKRRDAATRWIRGELQAHLAHPANPRVELAFVAEARKHAAERGVEQPLASDLDRAEAEFADMWWKAELAQIGNVAPTPVEQLAYLEGVRSALPAAATAARRAAEDETTSRRTRLFASYEERRAQAFASPAAQALYELLIHAAQGSAVDTPARERIALAARATFSVTLDGCDEVRNAPNPVPAGTGAHHVDIHVTAECSATETASQRTGRDHWTTETTEEYWDTEYEEVCTSNYEAPTCTQRSYKGVNNGACVAYRDNSSQSCQKVPKQVRKTRTVSVPHDDTYEIKVRTLSARISGTYTVTVDGVEQRIPFSVPLTDTEEEYSSHQGSSSFTGRSPASVLRELVSEGFANDVRAVAARVQDQLLAAYLTGARTKLAAGDAVGAEGDVATAMFAGASQLDDAFAPLAERAGMSLAVYRTFLHDGTLAMRHELPAESATLVLPGADEELAAQATKAELAEQAYKRDRERDLSVVVDSEHAASLFDIGVDQWTALDGNATHGLALTWGKQHGSGGMGRFFMSQFAMTLDLNFGQFAAGLDAHQRMGVGLRHPWVSLAGYGVAGISRRPSTATGDAGVPLSLDAGYGVQLVLGPAKSRRLELYAERLLRPLVDDPEMGMAVEQRLRYEVRYVKPYGEDALGVRGWCAFDQTSSGDVLFVSAPTTTRVCIGSVFVAY